MSSKTVRYLIYLIKAGLFILPVTALIVADTMFFPFITGKNFFFRIVVEVLFFLWILIAVFDRRYLPKKSVLFIIMGVTFLSLVISTVFSINPIRSFWSNYERMEGLIGHIHLFLYFLVLTSVLRVKRDWKIFFGISLFVSFIVTIYSFLQFFGKLAIHQSQTRLDATFGNSTYLAIFMVFHMFLIALFMFWFRKLWVQISLGILFLLEFMVMILTATRGAVLGFFGGLFLFGLLSAIFSKNRKIKKTFGALVACLVLLVFVFILVKDQPFIRNNYVLSRFASMSFTDTTVDSRFTIWGMSWRGFQENPVFGWGPENYNLVFNKYYEPNLYKQEPWFDRAHNVMFDWLIHTGIVGFVSYLGIFIAVLFMVWKGWKSKRFTLFETVAITSMIGAYLFNNLFVFDNLTSYFMLFSVLGFVHFLYTSNGEEEKNQEQKKLKSVDIGFGGYLLVTGAFLLVVVSLYFANVKPIMSAKHLLRALSYANQSGSHELALAEYEKVFSYNTFGTTEAREQFSGYVNNVYADERVSQEKRIEVAKKVIKQMETQVEEVPFDARYRLFLGFTYIKIGNLEKALEHLNKALEFSPKKQQILFAIADVYLSAGDDKKALEALRKAYELDKRFRQAATNLAMVAVLDDSDYGNGILAEIEQNFGSEILLDKQLLNAYVKMGNYEKARDVLILTVKKEPNNAQLRVNLAATYLHLGEKEKSIEQIEEAVKINPNFRTQADKLISDIRAGWVPE